VDDTIHFLSRYHFFTRGNDDVENALRKTIEHEARPIMTTSIALALGFMTLTLSSFQPVVYFGALSALVMMLALFSTFVLTPVLLSFTRLVTVWDMLSMNLKVDVLSHSPIFQGLKSYQVKQAILSGSIKHAQGGEVIIDQGRAGDEFYVVLEGSATATHRDQDGSIHTLGYLKAGDLFGEVAQLSKRNRLARVTANENSQLLEMKWESIRQLGRFHPRVAMRMYRNLATILSRRVADFTEEREKSHDELTGALTKPFLCEIFQQEIMRSKHFAEPMSLMLLDINIQPVDEEIGHTLSDKIIVTITRTIKGLLQPTDILARWDECTFMVMLPRAKVERAIELAKVIESSIETSELTSHAHIDISATVTEVLPSDERKDAIDRLELKLAESKKSRKSLQVSQV